MPTAGSYSAVALNTLQRIVARFLQAIAYWFKLAWGPQIQQTPINKRPREQVSNTPPEQFWLNFKATIDIRYR